MDDPIFGGIESDEDHTTIVLFTGDGKKIVEYSESALTHSLRTDLQELLITIKTMVDEAKKQARLSEHLTLVSLGLSLNNWERNDQSYELLHQLLESQYPHMSQYYHICSNISTIMAIAGRNHGLVLSAGTGSFSYLINPNGSTARCGGWGHKLTEVGSAAWVSKMAVRTVTDHEDNLKPAPYDTTFIKRAIFDHFRIKDRFGLLRHYYQEYNKSFHGGLYKRIAEGARSGDPLCQWLMYQTGRSLGEYLAALYPSVDQVLIEESNGLEVICVGHLWRDFDLMQSGFRDGATSQPGPKTRRELLKAFTLLRPEVSIAEGAAYLASEHVTQYHLQQNGSRKAQQFYSWSG